MNNAETDAVNREHELEAQHFKDEERAKEIKDNIEFKSFSITYQGQDDDKPKTVELSVALGDLVKIMLGDWYFEGTVTKHISDYVEDEYVDVVEDEGDADVDDGQPDEAKEFEDLEHSIEDVYLGQEEI